MTGRNSIIILTIVFLVVLMNPVVHAFGQDVSHETAEEQAEEASPKNDGLSKALIALAAALAIGLCAIATGIAQSRIGSAGCGTLAERPETSGTIILLVAIPETMVILGFVIAIVLIFAL